MKIIDFHTHLGDVINGFDLTMVEVKEKPFRFIEYAFEKLGFKSPLPGKQPSWLRLPLAIEVQKRHPWGTIENLLKSMEKNGITHAVVHPIEPMTPTDWLLNYTKGNKRIIPFASVNPKDPQKIEKLKKYKTKEIFGLKLHPILQRTSPEDASYFQIIEEFRTLKKTVIFHTGEFDYFVPVTKYSAYGNPQLFEKIIKAFPDVKFVIGHSGLLTPEKAIPLAEKYANVYLETSFQSLKSLKNIFSRVAHDKLLFGTDWPSSFQEAHLKIMKKAVKELPQLEERIFYRNAEEILGREFD